MENAEKYKKTIIEYYEKFGKKHYTRPIQRNHDLIKFINEKTSSFPELSLPEKISYIIHNNVSPYCEISGKKKKFISFEKGFGFCGKTGTCECARKQISEKIARIKSDLTTEEKKIISLKREETNLKRYGVKNQGQRPETREKHREYYNNPENIRKANEKYVETMKIKYGVSNPRSIQEVNEKIKQTCNIKYGVNNVAQIPSTKQKLKQRIEEYKKSGYLLKYGYDKIKQYMDEVGWIFLISPNEYKGFRNSYEFQCKTCGRKKVFIPYKNRIPVCRFCYPIEYNYKSREENEVFDFITKELGVTGYQKDKSIISPLELDMVFPEQKIAVEYCGLYWHSELSRNKDKNYHFLKMKLANEKSYRLITIFSDEWKYNKNKVKSVLKTIFKKNDQKYDARKMTITTVNYAEAKNFYDLYHLQGGLASSTITYGLIDKNSNLMACMSFSKPRMGNKIYENCWELTRFSTNGSIIRGGASKLLTHFIRNHNPKEIITYADLRYSDGSLYKKLGFQETGKPVIGYFYVENYERRYHRFNFRKNILVKNGADPLKTEWQIMQELGYDRIWDCGHQKYVLKLY